MRLVTDTETISRTFPKVALNNFLNFRSAFLIHLLFMGSSSRSLLSLLCVSFLKSDNQKLQQETTKPPAQQLVKSSVLTHAPRSNHNSYDAAVLGRYDEFYSSSNQSGSAGPDDKNICMHGYEVDPTNLRASASGASASGVVPRRRKHRVIRSLSHMTSGSCGSGNGALVGSCSTRIHRTRGSRVYGGHRQESSDTIEDRAGELMKMVSDEQNDFPTVIFILTGNLFGFKCIIVDRSNMVLLGIFVDDVSVHPDLLQLGNKMNLFSSVFASGQLVCLAHSGFGLQ